MKDIFTVIKFTLRETIRKKSVIISTIIIMALIVVGFSIPKIIEAVNKDKEKEVLVISDTQNVFEGNLSTLENYQAKDFALSIKNNTYEELKEKVDKEEIHSAILIEKEANNLKIKYIVKNLIWDNKVPEDVLQILSQTYSNMQIKKVGLTEQQLEMLTPNFSMDVEQTQEEEVDQGNVLLMMAFSIILSVSIIFFTTQVASSITTEKTSKIMETLVTSTSPRTIVIGKTIGIGIIALTQIVLIAATALVSANVFLDSELINSVFAGINFTPLFIITTVIYFILGYFAYALLYALTGSLVTKPEDIQSANTPVSLLAMIGYYLGYFSIVIDPTSQLSSFAGIFPLSSPFCMPARILMGLGSWTDVIISLVLLVVMVIVIAKIAIKVYSNAIINYGTKMSIKDVFKIYKEK